MEFKATKDIRADAEFTKSNKKLYKYLGCLQMSNDPIIKQMVQWVIDSEIKQWNIIFNHLLELDREIQRLNKELIFKDTE